MTEPKVSGAPKIAVVTDESVVRSEVDQVTAARSKAVGEHLQSQRARSRDRKAAQRTLAEHYRPTAPSDDAEVERALRLLRDEDPGGTPSYVPHPSGRRPGRILFDYSPVHVSDYAPVGVGGTDTIIVSPQSYSYWQWGNLWYSTEFTDDPADQYTRQCKSVDGEPDLAYGEFGFHIVLRGGQYVAAEVVPWLNYEYQSVLVGPTRFWGDGEAWWKAGFFLAVWQNGEQIGDTRSILVDSDTISGGPNRYKNDSGRTDVNSFKISFDMQNAEPYVVSIGGWLNCDSSCSPGACGQAYIDLWMSLGLVFIHPQLWSP
jgi:hypothetical protein